MTITIKRQRRYGAVCDGIVEIGNDYYCDCTEHLKHMAEPGRYELTTGRTAGRKALIAQAAYLCKGNGVWDATDGRIVLGTTITPGCIKWSHEPFELLYARVKKQRQRHHKVYLEIVAPEAPDRA